MIEDFFTYDKLSNSLKYNYNGEVYSIIQSNIINAIHYPKQSIIILTTDNLIKEEIIGYNYKGNEVFRINAPNHYKLWYLDSTRPRIACMGKDDFAEPSGGSGWWFIINILNGSLTKDDWVY